MTVSHPSWSARIVQNANGAHRNHQDHFYFQFCCAQFHATYQLCYGHRQPQTNAQSIYSNSYNHFFRSFAGCFFFVIVAQWSSHSGIVSISCCGDRFFFVAAVFLVCVCVCVSVHVHCEAISSDLWYVQAESSLNCAFNTIIDTFFCVVCIHSMGPFRIATSHLFGEWYAMHVSTSNRSVKCFNWVVVEKHAAAINGIVTTSVQFRAAKWAIVDILHTKRCFTPASAPAPGRRLPTP